MSGSLPRGLRAMGRGHAVAAASFLASALAVGAMFTFGVFIEPLEAEFGWSRAQVTGALTAGMATGFFVPLAVGGLLDRYGPRVVMTVSLFVIAAGFGLRPFMTDLWHFYALTALVSAGTPGATDFPMGRLIGAWFPRTRGRMLGIAGSGNQVGGLTVLPLASLMVVLSGWGVAYGILAALFAVGGLVAATVVREPSLDGAAGAATPGDEPGGGAASLRGAARTLPFYGLLGTFLSSAVAEMVIFPQLIPHLQNEGLSAGTATAALSMVALLGLPGKIVLGRLAEAITGRRALLLSAGMVSAGIGGLAVAGSSPLVWPAVGLFGAGFGALGPLYALAITEQFGLRAYGSILGSFKTATALVVLPAPPLAGWVFDMTGSYQVVLLAAAGIAAAAIPLLLATGRRGGVATGRAIG